MKLINVRAFVRGAYRDLAEPTEVIAGHERIGTWYPAGTEPAMRFVLDPSVTATAGRAPSPYYDATTTTTTKPSVSTQDVYRKIAARPKA